jgi:putative Holliday junction resolvase
VPARKSIREEPGGQPQGVAPTNILELIPGIFVMRILGLDIGDRRIGVAMSDPEGILATPLTIIEHADDESDVKTIAGIVEREQVGKIITGLPRSMSGEIGAQAEKVKTFAGKLAGAIKVPLEYRDERLSTISAGRLMREARTQKPSKDRKKTVHDDAVAAAIILQDYLDEVRDNIRDSSEL